MTSYFSVLKSPSEGVYSKRKECAPLGQFLQLSWEMDKSFRGGNCQIECCSLLKKGLL